MFASAQATPGTSLPSTSLAAQLDASQDRLHLHDNFQQLYLADRTHTLCPTAES